MEIVKELPTQFSPYSSISCNSLAPCLNLKKLGAFLDLKQHKGYSPPSTSSSIPTKHSSSHCKGLYLKRAGGNIEKTQYNHSNNIPLKC